MATGARSTYLAAANVVYLSQMHTLGLFGYRGTFFRFNLFMATRLVCRDTSSTPPRE